MKLLILAEDIKTTWFFDANDCAITRALKRANHTGKHLGIMITNSSYESYNSNLFELNRKVIQMYQGEIIPEDFEFTLKLNEENE